jgi:uncharacterized protein (TIGR03437 family)
LRSDLIRACRDDDAHQFGEDSASYTDLPNPVPLPTTLADTQVLVNGNPAPIFAVSPRKINFQVPMSTPTGISLIEVVRQSTGQTLGSYTVAVKDQAPGLFFGDHTQITPFVPPDPCLGGLSGICYQALANNADGSANSLSNPALHGTTVSLFGTGQGPISGAPADGDITPGMIATSYTPRVLLNGQDMPVSYSGLAPAQPGKDNIGVWEIDFKILDTVQSGTYSVIVVTPDNLATNDKGKLQTTLTVK